MRSRNWILGLGLALSLVLAAAPAQARTIAEEKSDSLGGCVHNTHNDATTCIIGWAKHTRSVYYSGAWHRKNFWYLVISMQRCNTVCYGAAVEGQLRPRGGAPGKAPSLSDPASKADVAESDTFLTPTAESTATVAAKQDICIAGTYVCAAPWNWFANYITLRQQDIENYFVYPCISGTIVGYGGAMGKNLYADSALRTGEMTRAEYEGVFAGPAQMGALAYGGCVAGEVLGGTDLIKNFYDAWQGGH